MAIIGNPTASGNGSGTICATLAADLTAFNANQAWLNTMKLGTRLTIEATGLSYVLTSDVNSTTRSFEQI